MTQRTSIADIQVAQSLFQFIEQDVLPGTEVTSEQFWSGLSDIINELSGENKALIAKREDLQAQIDSWHKTHQGDSFEFNGYKQFLKDISYLETLLRILISLQQGLILN